MNLLEKVQEKTFYLIQFRGHFSQKFINTKYIDRVKGKLRDININS